MTWKRLLLANQKAPLEINQELEYSATTNHHSPLSEWFNVWKYENHIVLKNDWILIKEVEKWLRNIWIATEQRWSVQLIVNIVSIPFEKFAPYRKISAKLPYWKELPPFLFMQGCLKLQWSLISLTFSWSSSFSYLFFPPVPFRSCLISALFSRVRGGSRTPWWWQSLKRQLKPTRTWPGNNGHGEITLLEMGKDHLNCAVWEICFQKSLASRINWEERVFALGLDAIVGTVKRCAVFFSLSLWFEFYSLFQFHRLYISVPPWHSLPMYEWSKTFTSYNGVMKSHLFLYKCLVYLFSQLLLCLSRRFKDK